MTIRRLSGALGAIALGIGLLVAVPSVSNADTTAATVPFAQDWSNTNLITTSNDWSTVPSIIGYRGDGLAAGTGVDPNTVLADGAATPVNVVAQSTAANTAGGIHEIEASGMVALQGSGTARAPHLVIRLDTTGLAGIGIDYDLVDLDNDDGVQPVALQYRVGATGSYTAVAGGAVADAATTPPGTIHVAAVLPVAADGQPVVDVRIITTDAAGSDSMTGIDNISIVSGVEPPPPPPPPDPVVTDIPSVQGTGADTPFEGQAVTVTGVVTSLFTSADELDGYFLQDPTGDGDPATSDGVFVFCGGNCPDPMRSGDAVTVTGTAKEFFGMTEIAATVSSTVAGVTTIESSGNPLPAAAAVDLPAATSTQDPATFESTEGMIVTIPQELAVSEYFELARFGEVVLTEGSRPYQFTHQSAPSVDGYDAFLADLATRRIILDDDNNDNNDAISGTADEPYPYGKNGLSIDNRYRGGDTITGLTGVMHWSFSGASGTDAWRIRPVVGNDYTFTSANPATPVPDVGGSLRVASFNVLNYFTTIDTTASNNTGTCGPLGNQDCRGADSVAELDQQRAKIVAAMKAIDADVLGLIEIQNDAGASTDDLVAGLNAATAPGTYAAIDTGVIGGDAIKVALVYRRGAVTPVGDFAILDSTVDPTYIDTANRPALIQTFREVGTGERFTVAINHFKSKGSGCAGDDDLGDGQGNCNATRTAAAKALAKFLATDPTRSGDPDMLIIGDLNSYRMEDPITALRNAGYTDLIHEFEGESAYSYLFDGQLGYLDQALANASLTPQVTGTSGWTINADEVPLFDYNDDLSTAGEASFERESSALELDKADPLRSSDHDPVVIGLDLGAANALTIDRAAIVFGRHGGGTATFSGQIDDTVSVCPRVGLSIEGTDVSDVQTFGLGRSACVGAGRGAVIHFDRTTSRFNGVSTLPTDFTLADATVRFTLDVDGVTYDTDVVGTLRGRVWTGPA